MGYPFFIAAFFAGVGSYTGILPGTSNIVPNVDYGLHLGKTEGRLTQDITIKDIKIISEKEGINKLTDSEMLKAKLLVTVEALDNTIIKTASEKVKKQLSKGEVADVNVTIMSSRNNDGKWIPVITIYEPDL